MDQRPLVSVITPVYNSEPWIDDCVQSLLSQSFDDWELILIDDGSTDGSLERCNAYAADPRVRIVSGPGGGGAGRARNVGLDLACGEYVFFLDSDDMLAKDSLSTMVELSADHALDILLFGAEVYCEDRSLEDRVARHERYYTRPVSSFKEMTGKEALSFMAAEEKFVVTPGLQFFRRSCLEQAGVRYPEGIIYEDNVFTVEAYLEASRVGMIPNKLFIRRLRADSIMTAKRVYSREFKSCFASVCMLHEIACRHLDDDDLVEAVSTRIDHFSRKASSAYKSMIRSGEEIDVSWMSKRQLLQFTTFFSTWQASIEKEIGAFQENKTLKKRLEKTEGELALVRSSTSFKLGKALTRIPRAVKKLFG